MAQRSQEIMTLAIKQGRSGKSAITISLKAIQEGLEEVKHRAKEKGFSNDNNKILFAKVLKITLDHPNDWDNKTYSYDEFKNFVTTDKDIINFCKKYGVELVSEAPKVEEGNKTPDKKIEEKPHKKLKLESSSEDECVTTEAVEESGEESEEDLEDELGKYQKNAPKELKDENSKQESANNYLEPQEEDSGYMADSEKSEIIGEALVTTEDF